MRIIRTISILLCILAIAGAVCACGNKKEPLEPTSGGLPIETTAVESTENEMPEETTQEEVESLDVASLEWEDDVLDCYDYYNQYGAYHLSFKYPSDFEKSGYDDSGEQSRSFWYSPNGEDANTSDYGIFMYFQQGGYGPRSDSLAEALVDEKVEERELGGATVLFGQMADNPDIEPNGYTYMYYMTYDEDDYARIWFMVHDQEENGAFRKAFEESLNFAKDE